MNLKQCVEWFEELKNQGVSEQDILDVLDFDSDFEVDYELLKEAKKIVYKTEEKF